MTKLPSPTIVGIYSSRPQSGKSTLAEEFEKRGLRRMSFAEPIKEMIRVLLRALGHNDAIIGRMVDGDLKEVIIPELGRSPRYLMQTLGTEWGRDIVHPHIWLAPIKNAIARGESIVVDDVRFENEYAVLQNAGATMIRVDRPVNEAANHQSEGRLDDFPFDFTLPNSGTKEDYLLYCGALAELVCDPSVGIDD